MIINDKHYRTVWMENGIIKTINQLNLPEKFELVTLHNLKEVADSINTMIIRGAPAIGGMCAYGLAQAILQLSEVDFDAILSDKVLLQNIRPTAYDATHALDFVLRRIQDVNDLPTLKKSALEAAEDYANLSVKACKKIGEYGERLITTGHRILTHCNAGALATVDYGTALAPIRIAHYNGKQIHVYVDETRPRLQGAKLTAWELAQEGIQHSVIVDNAAGYYMQQGKINLVITGADRIASNGDAANKIGTYEKAVVAHENNIPFYVAAPLSTIDFNCATGNQILIEQRDGNEIREISGKRIMGKNSPVKNPAFDLTPSRYISGIITEKGIFNPKEIRTLGKMHV
jgi:translation initiation factor eIF-2B subunit alpha/methylthioribose-1-phosphate isomerase